MQNRDLKLHLVGLQIMQAGLVFYAILLPFQPMFPPITAAVGLFWLGYLLSFKLNRFTRLVQNKWFWAFAVLYLIQIVGVFYSPHQDLGAKDLLLKITLLLWPAAFASLAELSKKHQFQIMVAFVGATLVSCLLCLALSFTDYLEVRQINVFMYQNLAHWSMLPNHYLGLYVSLSVLLMTVFLFKSWNKITLAKKVAIGAMLLFLILIQALFAVRIQMLALPVTLVGILFLMVKERGFSLKKYSLLFGLLAIFMMVLIWQPGSRRRINDTLDEIKSMDGMVNQKQTNHRVFIWKYGLEVIQENFWIGTGTGAADLALHKKLKNCNAPFWNGHRKYYLYEKVYNYHNSYLQHWAANGILSFLIFTGILLIGLINSIRKKQFYATAFVLIFTLSIITESMLERQAGVYLFGFFFALFVVHKGQLKKTTEE